MDRRECAHQPPRFPNRQKPPHALCLCRENPACPVTTPNLPGWSFLRCPAGGKISLNKAVEKVRVTKRHISATGRWKVYRGGGTIVILGLAESPTNEHCEVKPSRLVPYFSAQRGGGGGRSRPEEDRENSPSSHHVRVTGATPLQCRIIPLQCGTKVR